MDETPDTTSDTLQEHPDDRFLRRLGGLHPPAAKPLFEVGRVINGWRLTAFIGRGGSGEVYRAEATGEVPGIEPGTAAAVKFLLRPESTREVRRFAREAALLRQEPHRCLPRFLGEGEYEGRPYLATEYLDPMDLPASDAAVARFILDLCDGVAFLHALGYVHRDIKPSNVMSRAGRPVLIDLGLVKDLTSPSPLADGFSPASSISVVDGHAMGVGTPGYASPEQFDGKGVSPASDVHALGVLADQCFQDSPPRCWREIIRRATSSIPSMRYRSIEVFRRAVKMRHAPSWVTVATLLVAAAAVGVAVPAIKIMREDANTEYVTYAVTDGNVIQVALKKRNGAPNLEEASTNQPASKNPAGAKPPSTNKTPPPDEFD